MENSKKFLSLGLSALSILPIGALLSSNINAGAGREQQEEQQGHYYTITFDLNGGTYNGDAYIARRFGGDEGFLMLPDPDYREGYKFMGWDSELGLLCAGKICDELNSNMHFTAVWESTAVDDRLQKVDEQLSSIETSGVSMINQYLSDMPSQISDMESRLNINVRAGIDTMRIMDDANALAEVEAELSKLDAQQKKCKEEIEELKSSLGEPQERAESFKNQVSHARQMLNSANDGDAQDMIDELESLVRSLEDEMNAGIGMALDVFLSNVQGAETHVFDFEMNFENFGMSHMELYY